MNPQRPQLFSAILALVFLTLGGCSKTEAPKTEAPVAPKPVVIDVVKETERSRSFLAVSRQLELGGPIYGYMDIDGDVQRGAGEIKGLLDQFGKTVPGLGAYANQDYGAIAATLGLTDVKAAGFSSVPESDGYFRNRTFLYTGGERHGLMAGLGGKPAPFKHVHLAPADAVFFAEGEMDLPVIYKTVKEVVAKVGGEPVGNQMEAAVKSAGESIALSVLDLIYGLKGRSAFVLRMDASKPMRIPGQPPGISIPSLSLLVCVEGIAPVVEVSLAKSPLVKRTDAGALHVYESTQPLPVEGLKPILVADGSTLYLATTREFFDECRDQKTSLAQDAAFQKALAHVGTEGNGLTYLSPRFFTQLKEVMKQNPGMTPDVKSVTDLIVAKLPDIPQPVVSVRTNLPDGVLFRSYWYSSLKQDVATLAVYNPLTVGLMAAMAIPAFQKVRVASQEKVILNNLRMLSAAADQYYLETGKTSATLADLVGPTKYVRSLQSVTGENYAQLRFALDLPLRLKLPDGRVIQYPMTPPASARPPGR